MGKRQLLFRAVVLSCVGVLTGLFPEARGVALQAPSQLPIGYWKLDEAVGPAVDSAGTANGTWNGTVTTVTTPLPPLTYNNQNGTVSRAISLAGALPDDFIEIANTAALEVLQENSYTMSAWFRPASIPPGTTDPAWNSLYGIIVKAGWHESLTYTRNQHIQFDHWKTGDVWAGTGSWQNGLTYAPGLWYHVTGVWNRAAGEVRLYVDGAPVGLATAVVEDNRDYAQNPWRIGIAYPGNGGDYSWPMDGLIDDVRLYNYALTGPQVAILAGGVPTPVGLTAQDGVQSVGLTWSAPATPAGYTAYTYNIYRAATPAGPFTQIATGVTGTTFTDSTASTTGPSTPYSYMVTAVSVAESGMAGPATASALLPTPRTSGNQEGLFDDNCACGSTIPGGATPWGAALGALLGLAFLRRRRRLFGGHARIPRA